jgi:hypothetical protein
VHIFGFFYRLAAVDGFGDYLPTRLRLQQCAKPLTNDFMVIG